MPSVQVVVSKYKEPHHWIDACREKGVTFTVYDKSDNPIEGAISVPNEGRESETILRYIITHYDALPDAVIFLQGDPRGTPVLHETYEEAVDALVELYHDACKGNIALKAALTHWSPADMDHVWCRKAPTLNEALFGTRKNAFRFGDGAQLLVPRENILCRPKEFYVLLRQRVLEFGNKSFDSRDETMDAGIDGYTLEVMWCAIFNPANELVADYKERLMRGCTYEVPEPMRL